MPSGVRARQSRQLRESKGRDDGEEMRSPDNTRKFKCTMGPLHICPHPSEKQCKRAEADARETEVRTRQKSVPVKGTSVMRMLRLLDPRTRQGTKSVAVPFLINSLPVPYTLPLSTELMSPTILMRRPGERTREARAKERETARERERDLKSLIIALLLLV